MSIGESVLEDRKSAGRLDEADVESINIGMGRGMAK